MEYNLFTTPSGSRSLKRLNSDVKRRLLKALQALRSNPQLGQQLEGEFRFLRSFHTRLAGADYRVAYELDTQERAVIIHYAATRENFYKELRRLPLKKAA